MNETLAKKAPLSSPESVGSTKIISLPLSRRWQSDINPALPNKGLTSPAKAIDIFTRQEISPLSNHKFDPSLTPFFDIHKSALLRQELIDLYGEEEGDEEALKTFSKDLETQAWELSGIPTPNVYTIHLLKEGSQTKLVHESNLHDKTDLLDVVTDKIRRGLEKKQSALLKEKLITAKVGETLIWVSPKRTPDESESDCPYVDSHLIVAKKVSTSKAEVYQYQSDLDYKELIKALNELSKNESISENTTIDQLLLTILTVNQDLQETDVWQALENASGRKIIKKPLVEYQRLHQKIKDASRFGGKRLLEAIKSHTSTPELQNLHAEILLSVLGDVESKKIKRDEAGNVTFETSCGSFGSIRGMAQGAKKEKTNEQIMWCTKCGEVNLCNTQLCYIPLCGGQLSLTRPINAAAA